VLHLAVPGSDREAVYPRTLVVALPGSRATVIETHLGAEGLPYLADAVTEIDVADGASLEHCRVEADAETAFHVATVQARLGRDARLVSNAASLGAGLARIDIGATLAEGAECTLNGLYLGDGSRHVDHHTSVDHAAPHGTSHQLYKGILSGSARAVFNGRIRVAEGASKTDAFQANRNLLLSREALVFTRPQLEIHADDVKCTHGATIGQLDAGALFYLRSRGIGEAEARRLLLEAFVGEVIGRIGFGPLAERLTERARAISARTTAEGGPR
jgi:Fe-S cluster assembly protein SufD